MMDKRYYVAYGSNLNIWQMKDRCPKAKVVGVSMIEDYELLFKGSLTGSYLTIEKKEGGRVPVAVWKVTKEDEARLDRYEGYPNFYYKKNLVLPVTDTKTGKTKERECFVYIMDEDRRLGIPDQYYIETCLAGYFHFGFDAKYLGEAQKRSEEATGIGRE